MRTLALLSLFGAMAPGQTNWLMRTVAGGGPDRLPARDANVNRPSGVCRDSGGVLYFVAREAHRVYRVDSDGAIRVVAGIGAGGFSGDGGLATQAALNLPHDCAIAADGAIYISDGRNNRIRRVDPAGVITTIAGTGDDRSTGNGGPATAAALGQPAGLALDGAGTLYVAETSTSVVRRIGADGVISAVAGTGRFGFGGDGGPAAQAALGGPVGVSVDAQGRIWIADTGNHRVRRVETNGNIVTVAGGANSGFAGDGGPAEAARLTNPRDVFVDPAGNAWIADSGNRRVRRIAPNGTITTVAGNGGSGYENENTPALTTAINAVALVADTAQMWIADDVNHRVRRVTLSDARVNTVAGNGQAGFSGDGGPALDASLANPRGIWASATELLIGDTDNNRVRRVDLATGLITTFAGTGAAGQSGDNGPAVRAQLATPWGVTRDASGNVFIGEFGNGRIRRVAPNGNITTFAGGGSNFSATIPPGQARLNEPVGLTTDAAGNLFIAERASHRIRRGTPDGALTTLAGTGEGRVIDAMSGPALAMHTANPYAVAMDGDSVLYTDDSAAVVARIREGQMQVLAGTRRSASIPATGDGGPATSAPLMQPRGVAPDGQGGFFLSESFGNRIRHVSADGMMRIIAGAPDALGGFDRDSPAGPGARVRLPANLSFVAPCTLYAADTGNHRIRRLRPEIRYTIRPEPEGLVLSVDEELAPGARTFSWEALTQHRVSAPSPQQVSEGTRYLAPAEQSLDLACAPAELTLVVPFAAEHRLTLAADEGGSVTKLDKEWFAAGSEVKLEATAAEGFVFLGWEGACTGTEPCTVLMDAPKQVRAKFGTP